MSNIVPYQDIEKMAIAVAKSGLFNVKTAEEAAKRLRIALNGSGMRRELEILCREAGIGSPYN